MRFRGSSWLIMALVALPLGAGCSGSETADAMGTARVRLITPQASSGELTQVTVTTDTGFSTDLARDATTGEFSGSLTLPAGMHALTGRAFVDAELVGESSPVPADIQAGVITAVQMQILDITGGNQPDFGPILESLSHPESTTAGTEVMFAVSFVDPDGDPVTIEWSDNCTDATFTAPTGPMTGWSKATDGNCTVTVTGTANGSSVSASFDMVVFAAGADQGAAELTGVFVEAPTITMGVFLPGESTCVVDENAASASCAGAIASPDVGSVQALVGWGNGTPGTFSVSDDCGGAFGIDFQDDFSLDARWLPPVTGAICRVTLQATNQEGVTASLSAAVLVRDGVERVPTITPTVNLGVSFTIEFCSVSSNDGPLACGALSVDETANVSSDVSWGDALPGTLVLSDDCGGTFVDEFSEPDFLAATWQPPAAPTSGCPVKATATSLEGVVTEAVLLVDVL